MLENIGAGCVFAVIIVVFFALLGVFSNVYTGPSSSGDTELRDEDGNITVAGLAMIDGLDGQFDAHIEPDDWFRM